MLEAANYFARTVIGVWQDASALALPRSSARRSRADGCEPTTKNGCSLASFDECSVK
jgi:hypothetical protein